MLNSYFGPSWPEVVQKYINILRCIRAIRLTNSNYIMEDKGVTKVNDS